MLARVLRVCSLSLLTTVTAFCQNVPQVAPLPDNPLELASSSVQTADTPEKRAAVLGLVERARQNTDLHGLSSAPFIIKVSFDSSGQVQRTGSGQLEEVWLSGQTYRWMARIGDYWQVRLANKGRIYDQRPSGLVPLRLRMLRTAVFWPIHSPTTRASLRTAEADWKGAKITCILVSGPYRDPNPPSSRRWEETEYCISQKTGLLQIYSEAPGIYTLYDYTNALQFHGHTVPSQITVAEGSNTVLTAHIESIDDGSKVDPETLKPTDQMQAQGPEPVLTAPLRFPQIANAPSGSSTPTVQPVIVHVAIGDGGKVLDAEVLPGGNPALEQSALDLVKSSVYPQPRQQNGSQLEAFINVKFVSGAGKPAQASAR